ESTYASEDALGLIDVRYEPSQPLLDARDAVRADAPLLHPETGSNVAAEWTTEFGDVDALFASADLVVEEELACQRHGAVPLEPRGLCAELDSHTGRLTVWGAAKVVHTNRRIL